MRWCCSPTSTASTTATPARRGAHFIPEVRGEADLDGVIAANWGESWAPAGWRQDSTPRSSPPDAGVPVLLASAAEAAAALSGGSVGTAFAARPVRLSARKFWVRHAADTKGGALRLDAGAVAAVAKRRRSLLAAGITGVKGRFYGGDVVDLLGPDGMPVARGIVAYDNTELAGMLGRSTADLPSDMQRPVVHADDLVPIRGS